MKELFQFLSGLSKKKENKLEKYKGETLYKMRNGVIARKLPYEEYNKIPKNWPHNYPHVFEMVSVPEGVPLPKSGRKRDRFDDFLYLTFDSYQLGERRAVGDNLGDGFDIVEFYKGGFDWM